MPDGPRTPRPVAGVPTPELADGGALAKAWLLELLAGAPLAAAASVPVADLAARGPALCAALAAAVGDDAALARVKPGGDLAADAMGAAALAGAGDPAAAAAAIAALRRALWAALCDGLRRDDAPAAVALAERVAHVADVVTAAVLTAPAPRPTAAAPPAPTAAPRTTDLATDLAGAEAPWLAAIDRALASGRGLAVLAIEADDAERLVAAGGRHAAALDAFEVAVRAAVEPAATVIREGPGRLWAIAAELDPEGATALAMRIADAAAAGDELAAAVGVAVHPHDGADGAALARHADERLFAARAAGEPVV